MKPTDLTKTLKRYKTGWLIIGSNNQVLAHRNSFELIMKVADQTKNGYVVPASGNYYGLVT